VKGGENMLSLTGIVFAQQQGNITVQRPAGFQVTDVGTIVSGAIGAAFIIAGLLVFAYLVWGGLQWITAGGDKANIEAARGRISSALVGMAIIAAAYAIILLLQYVFGYQVLGGIPIPQFF
jgi:hypothetical protein